jgi:hypothetical protein
MKFILSRRAFPALSRIPEAALVVPYERLLPNEQREIAKSMMVMLGNEDIYCVPSRSLPIHPEGRNGGSGIESDLQPRTHRHFGSY